MANLLQPLTNTVKYWYIPLIFGIIFVLSGIYVFTTPLETYLALSVLFSVTFLISGITEVFFSLQNTKSLNGWAWYLVDGLLSATIGAYLIVHPAVSMAILPFVVAFSLLFRSFQLLGFSFDMKNLKMKNWGNVALTSIVGIIFSFLLLASPIITSMSIVSLTAFALIFIGGASIGLSFNLKQLKDASRKMTAELKNRIEALNNEINNHIKQ